MRGVHAELASIKGRIEPLERGRSSGIAARTRVLCLDEFFVADIADAMILGGLFAGLFRRGVTLVATSNRRAAGSCTRTGCSAQRFLPAIELIEAHVDVLHLDGGIDYRLRQLEQAPTYLDATLTGHRRPRSRSALRRLPAAPQRARNCSRSKAAASRRARRARDGLVRVQRICEGPRSQNDYIELARSYGTIFIANIPRIHAGARGRGAPLHHADRRALRSRRQNRGIGRGAAGRVVSRRATYAWNFSAPPAASSKCRPSTISRAGTVPEAPLRTALA